MICQKSHNSKVAKNSNLVFFQCLTLNFIYTMNYAALREQRMTSTMTFKSDQNQEKRNKGLRDPTAQSTILFLVSLATCITVLCFPLTSLE